MRDRVETVARELATGGLRAEKVKSKMVETRHEVLRAWKDVSDVLVRQGQSDLSVEVRKLAEGMQPPMTDREWIAAGLVERAREQRVMEQFPRGGDFSDEFSKSYLCAVDLPKGIVQV
jgi:hypothetical protein